MEFAPQPGHWWVILSAVCLAAASGCGDGAAGIKAPDLSKEETMAKITVTSPAFDAGSRIPRKHTGEGDDVSPHIDWEGIPEGTQEIALICDDPDAPRPKPWVHWVLYGVAADRQCLDEGSSGGGLEGKNDFGKTSYGGPMPPAGHGVHHYHFKVYALDRKLDLRAGATKEQLLDAMRKHVLAEGELVGTYERK